MTLDGEVVGVNHASGGDIGFAISPAIVARVVPTLIELGAYRHPYLNVRTLDVSPSIAEANGLAEPQGVLVVGVTFGPSSGALRESRGTRVVRGREIPVGGDVIVGIDGQEIRSHEELTRYHILGTEPDETVTLDLLRNGQHTTEHIALVERPYPDGRSRQRGRRSHWIPIHG